MAELISTQAENYREETVEKGLFSFHRAKKITIVSAYIDYNSICNVVHICNQQGNRNVLLKIFSDKHSIKKLYNKYPEEMEDIFDSIDELQEGSGIFSVNYGKLFHTKCYQIETKARRIRGGRIRRGRIITILGSLNFTQNGFYENEEILYKVSDSKHSDEQNEIHEYISKYISTIEEEYSEECSIENLQRNQRNSNLRDLLLNGYLWNEIRENETFSIDLKIDKEFRKTVSKKHPALEDKTSNVLKIEKLIATDGKLKSLIDELPEKRTTRSSWKRYCIHTKYGYWSAINFKKRIDSEITKKSNTKSYYETLVKIIKSKPYTLRKAFLKFCTELKPHVGGDDWELSNDTAAKKHWKNRCIILLKKLDNQNFIKRLSNQINYASVPDLWNDEIASKEFEDSFLEEILYISNKDRDKNVKDRDKNVVVKSIEKLFDNVRETSFNEKSTEDLKKSLEDALKNTKIEDIFDCEN